MSACHSTPPGQAAHPSATTIDKVWLVEASGAPVNDSSVTFSSRTGRTIVLRHAAPDEAIFAILRFPPRGDSSQVGDSVHVTIHPTAGKYGFTLATADKLAPGTEATFSYAIHFQTPADAAVKYPNPGRFEQLAAAAVLGADNSLQFLVSTRPAADMLQFPMRTPGTYVLAAPR